jgi:Holliday junction resolvase RusA-like endonuclease
MIEFFVPGKPQALKRHRTFRSKLGFNVQVDPSAEAKYSFSVMADKHKPDKPFRDALIVLMEFRFPRPKAHYTKKGLKDSAPYLHTSRPDADNLIKFVCDALNGIFWHDDSLISRLIVMKRYSGTPGVYVKITQECEGVFCGNNMDTI